MIDLQRAILDADGLTDSQRIAMLRLATKPLTQEGRERQRARPTIGYQCHSRPRNRMHETWRQRRSESGMHQQEWARTLGVSIGIIRALEGSYSNRTSGPSPEAHADAERKYQDWLDRATRPLRLTG